ncbi:hypothetical protein RYX36_004519 [Vicia faba]
MTFKKDFREQMVPEWEKHYMDYEGLKTILKQLKSSNKVKDNNKLLHHRHGSNNQRDDGIEDKVIDVEILENDVEKGEADARFFEKLDEELDKVNVFYKEEVEAVKHEATLLSKQVEALVALRVKVKSPNPGLQQKDSMVSTEVDYKRIDPMEVLENVKIDNALQSPKSSIKNVFTDSNDVELSFNKEELKKVEKQLRLVFVEFYQKLLHLKDYSFMNLSAFSKIMKKYEKKAQRGASIAYMRVVDNSFLGTSDEVSFLLEKVESIFIRNFTHSNHKKGRKLLRPKNKRERHSITFFTGFFSGCFVALLVATILRIISQHLMKKKAGTFYMENIFPLYSLFGYITLHMLMYAANTYFWRRYRINYQFLFGIRPGTELDHRDVFLLTTGHAVIAVLCFLINLQLEMNQTDRSYKTATELVPLSLIVLVILITFCPFNIIYRSSRFFFIRCLFRCICAPFFPVSLSDFFLADQLTSQFQSFRSFVLYICYYGLGEHSRRQNKCRSHGIYNIQYFMAGVIPYWFRLAQCMRQLYGERDIDHAINGSKYLSTIVAMVIRTTFETKKGMTWKVLALISSCVAILMNTYWDIVKDWSLLQRHSKNRYLRDKLIVSHKSVYYIAMVVNVVLRLSWMQLVLELDWRPLHKVAINTCISCLEIIRRGIWNFFR